MARAGGHLKNFTNLRRRKLLTPQLADDESETIKPVLDIAKVIVVDARIPF